jgi:hypothetical protein
MDGHLPWRLAFVDDAAREALKCMQQAEMVICRLRKEGHQKRSPELRAARLARAEHAMCWAALQETRDLLAPPLWMDSCSQGPRRWYDRWQAAVLRAADELRGWDPVTGLWPQRTST